MTIFKGLQLFKYNMIMADPAWDFGLWSEKGQEKSAHAQYACMSTEDIKNLPVNQLASGDCILWLWCTAPMLDVGFDVLRSWGFNYVTQGSWNKKTKTNKYRWGTGYVLRSTHEPFLIGRVGNPKTSRSIPSAFDGLAREHSRKPDEAYALAEKMLPNAWRLDLFSREEREGWDNWGNESDKFNAAEEKT